MATALEQMVAWVKRLAEYPGEARYASDVHQQAKTIYAAYLAEQAENEQETFWCTTAACLEEVTCETGVMDHVGDWYCQKHATERGIEQHYNG